MNVVEAMVTYLDSRDSKVLEIDEGVVSTEDLTVIVLNLLSWLRLEYGRELRLEQGKNVKLKPMQLEKQYDWTSVLIELIKTNHFFRNSFAVSNNELMLCKEMSAQMQKDLRKMANDLFCPPAFS